MPEHRIISPGFRERVYFVVRQVPKGFVTTYGDVGSVLGSPRVARQVGYALAALPPFRVDVPWHRVINAKGSISFRSDDIRGQEQRLRLVAEGIDVYDDGRLSTFDELRYLYDRPFIEYEPISDDV